MTKISTDKNKIAEILNRGVEETIEKDSIEKKLTSGAQLRIKFGADPSKADLHLGHSIPLRKLKQFQDLGHQVIFLIGDFTAMIGDPSGKSETRPMISREQIKKNMASYIEQAGKILDLNKTEIRYNSEWYDKKGPNFLLELSAKFTVARILERDDFKKRIKNNIDISMMEIVYPLLQGYDSVELEADIEIGGTDQKFNLLMGRKVQKRYNSKKLQDVITLPLIEGLDGVQKMSKSLDNYIGLTDNSNEMFGKIMSIPDSLILKYFTLCTDVSTEEIESIKKQMANGANPRDFKIKLAKEIVKIYHDEKSADEAEQNFINQFQKNQIPEDITEFNTDKKSQNIIDLLNDTKLVTSKSNARQMIDQKAVKVDGELITNIEQEIELQNGTILQKGKRGFVKIIKS